MSEFVEYKEACELAEFGLEVKFFSFFSITEHIYPIDKYGVCTTVSPGDLVELDQFKYLQCMFGDKFKYVGAPLYQQAFKWFRDNHSLYSEIGVDQTMEPKFCYTISWYKEEDGLVEWVNVTDREMFFLEYTQEKAELNCLKKLIEIVKQRKK